VYALQSLPKAIECGEEVGKELVDINADQEDRLSQIVITLCRTHTSAQRSLGSRTDDNTYYETAHDVHAWRTDRRIITVLGKALSHAKTVPFVDDTTRCLLSYVRKYAAGFPYELQNVIVSFMNFPLTLLNTSKQSSKLIHVLVGLLGSQHVTLQHAAARELDRMHPAVDDQIIAEVASKKDVSAGIKGGAISTDPLTAKVAVWFLMKVFETSEANARNDAEMSANLSAHVGMLVPCGQGTIAVPGQVMIQKVMKGALEGKYAAFRCPNSDACENGRQVHWRSSDDRSNDSSNVSVPMCSNGYDDGSPGCVGCVIGFGRSAFDPFTCKKCSRPLVEYLAYVGIPVLLVGVGFVSARNFDPRPGGINKILLSFGLSASITFNALRTSRAYKLISSETKLLLRIPIEIAEASSGLHSSSYDCFFEKQQAPLNYWWCLSNAVPLSCFVLTMLVIAFRNVGCSGFTTAFLEDLVQPSLILTNIFLPNMVAAQVRYFPCFHLQIGDTSPFYMSYDSSSTCQSFTSRYVQLLAAGFLYVVGPIYWLALLRYCSGSPERQPLVRFLTELYKPEVRWWEIIVLLRRVAIASITSALPLTYCASTQLTGALLICAFSLTLHLLILPYKVRFLNQLEGASLSVSVVTTTLTLYATSNQWSLDAFIVKGVMAIVIVVLTCFLFCLFGLLLQSKIKRFVPE
jgi:hypothetical protein